MATVQEIFKPDNNILFYGTNQIQKCVKFGASTPYQIVGLVPCEIEECDPSTGICLDPPCDTLITFTGFYNSFLFEYVNKSDTADFRLFKWDGSAWVEQAVLDNTQGIKYDLGDLPPYDSYAGYELNWQNVFDLYGSGIYRFAAYDATTPDNSLYSQAFNLKEYNSQLANDTLFIEVQYEGDYPNINYTEDNGLPRTFDLTQITFRDANCYRGKFIPTAPESEETDIRFSNDRRTKYYANQTQTYDLRLYSPTYDMASRLYFYGLKASKVYITPNSVDQVKVWNRQNIIGTEDYDFETFRYYNKLENVVYKVVDEYARDYSRR